MNAAVTLRPSARGPDQLSPLLSFKTCLIGFPKRPRRGKRGRASLLRALVFQRRGGGGGGDGGGGGASLISHHWTPPVAINQTQSPTGARRGSEEGSGGREGGRGWSRAGASPTPSHGEPQQTDTNTPSSPPSSPSSSPRVHTSATPRSSSLLTQIDLGPV